MRTRLRSVVVMLLAATLLGCAATPYQAASDGYGYSEQLLEGNRYRVSFVGNSETSQETVQNYLLYRAAELTLARGYDYFILSGNNTQNVGSSGPRVGIGLGGFRFGGHGGLSIGISTVTGAGKQQSYMAQADVVLFAGKKPADNPDAFDARDLMANLAPEIRRPGH